MKQIVLLVDDDSTLQTIVSEDLPSFGFEVITCPTLKEARTLLARTPIEVLLLDQLLPDGSGADFFESIREELINVPVIFITSFPDISNAVRMMKCGAADYILKPFSIEDLAARIKRALDATALRSEVMYHRDRLLPSHVSLELIGVSDKIKAVKRSIELAVQAPSNSILISGETGTGKEIVARLIHEKTHGTKAPFIEIDCAVIPKKLFQNELFGNEKGAFEDSTRFKRGIFELGKDGTLFLDHVEEIDFESQGQLLRVLETRRFRRVGAVYPIAYHARIIAATSKDPKILVREKKLRADLYYRLSNLEIKLSPLRERKEDIEELAHYFLKQAILRFGKLSSKFSRKFLRKLQNYDFPGNGWELRNLVDQAIIQSSGDEIDLVEFLPSSSLQSESQTSSSEMTLQEGERVLITGALAKNHGNKAAAARQLGISRLSLLRRIDKLK